MSSPTRKSENNASGQILTMFSTASATGKTALAINFAADLAERGYRVCLLDCDIQFGDVANYLNIQSKKSLFQMYEDEDTNAADLTVETPWGFDVLPAPAELDEAYQINQDIVTRAIVHLKANYDYIVIDTTTGFSEINMGVLEKTDTLFLLCVVDFIPSVKNLKMGMDSLQRIQFDTSRIRLVLNRNKAETQISVKDVEGLLERRFRYMVSNDYMGMQQSLKDAEPIVLSQKPSKVADEISNIMDTELGGGESSNGSGGLWGWLWK